MRRLWPSWTPGRPRRLSHPVEGKGTKRPLPRPAPARRQTSDLNKMQKPSFDNDAVVRSLQTPIAMSYRTPPSHAGVQCRGINNCHAVARARPRHGGAAGHDAAAPNVCRAPWKMKRMGKQVGCCMRRCLCLHGAMPITEAPQRAYHVGSDDIGSTDDGPCRERVL